MSKKEREAELGAITASYLDAKQELACLRGQANRYTKAWTEIGKSFERLTQPMMLPDMSDYPTAEEVASLLSELPRAEANLNNLAGQLQFLGLDLK